MDRKELHRKFLDNQCSLKIKFKRNLAAGKYSDPTIHGVFKNEEALLVDVSYEQKISFNYPSYVTVLDVIVTRLSKEQTKQIDQGKVFIPAEQMEKAINTEIVLPENIDFNNVLKIICD